MLPKKEGKVAVIPVSETEVEYAFRFFKMLQAGGIVAEFVHLGTLSKKMKVANRLDCDVALLLGEAERASQMVTVKFMNEADETKKIKSIAFDEIIGFLATR
jgi:histidyl-tRNA synthetase